MPDSNLVWFLLVFLLAIIIIAGCSLEEDEYQHQSDSLQLSTGGSNLSLRSLSPPRTFRSVIFHFARLFTGFHSKAGASIIMLRGNRHCPID